jgi:cytoskeleton protein RodZ
VSKLDSTQLEQLKEIGEYLYQIRQQHAISLDEVANKTFIPLRLLRAIEVGRGDLLPEPIFIQGFIRRYGDVLGLDGTDLAKQFTTTSTTSSEVPVAQGAVATASVSESSPEPRQNKPAGGGRSLVYISSILLGVGTIAAIVYGISQISSAPEQTARVSPSPELSAPEPSATAPSPAASAAVASPTPAASASIAAAVAASPSPTTSPSSSPSPSNAPIQVNLNLVNRSWLRIVVDGKTSFEGTLEQGETRSWTAQKSLTILAGNAGGVSVAFNGGQSQPMGATGAVVRRTFTPQTAATPQTAPASP